MAAITSSNVTLISQWEVAALGGFRETIRIVDIVLSSQGGTALDIPASVLGYSVINWAVSLRAIDGSAALSHVPVVLEVSGLGILPCDVENATDANRGNPANYTGTLRVMLAGRRDANT